MMSPKLASLWKAEWISHSLDAVSFFVFVVFFFAFLFNKISFEVLAFLNCAKRYMEVLLVLQFE